MAVPVLSLRGVSKSFGRLVVLNQMDLEVASGESVAVVGRSGAGKSTLLRIAALFEPPTSGTVLIDGRDATGATDRDRSNLRGASIGYLFQEARLLDNLSAEANIKMAFRFGPQLIGRQDRFVDELLDRAEISHLRDCRASQLSGGERQRVAICRALAKRPSLVLADEPTSALDSATSFGVLNLLFDTVRAGAALVVVTHDTQVADRADRSEHLAGSFPELRST